MTIATERAEAATALGEGLALAVERLRTSDAKSKVVILLTDGVNNAGVIEPAQAAELAVEHDIRVYTVGAGTNGIAPMPVRRPNGTVRLRPMKVEIDEKTLESIAERTGGMYYNARNVQGLEKAYAAIDKLEKVEITEVRYLEYTHHFGWFTLAALLALALSELARGTWLRDSMSQLVFEAPHYIHGLWLVAAIAGALWWLDRRLRRDTLEWIAPQLRARLIRSTTPAQRALRIVLLALAAAAMVTALMRPQWGYSTIITPRSGAQIMIALDVSRSMLAEDVVPNRLDRAKAEIRDLLSYLNGDQVGLIAFAGRATVLSPLTPDFRFVDLSLRDAIPGVTGRGGTRLEEPIRKASAGFGNAGHVSRSLILITDGEDHDSFPKAAAEQARDLGVRILAIGFGDEGGAPITITKPNTGARTQLRDDNGAVVQSRLDGDLLRELASITDGAYIPAGTGALDLESIYEAHIAPLTRGSIDGRERRIPNEVYQWPLLASMMFLFGALLSTYSARTARTSANRFGTLVLAFTLVFGPTGAPEAQKRSFSISAPSEC